MHKFNEINNFHECVFLILFVCFNRMPKSNSVTQNVSSVQVVPIFSFLKMKAVGRRRENARISFLSSFSNQKRNHLLKYGYTVTSTIALLLLFFMLASSKVEGVNTNSEKKSMKDGLTFQDVPMMDSNLNSIFVWKSEMGMSSVRIIPNHHHVSAFLNGGVSTRFLYMNEKPGNVLSILVTPCTSVVHWNVKYWPIEDNTNTSLLEEPQLLKSFRTERSGTFHDFKSRKGIYSIEIKALQSDSYLHLYALNAPDPIRIPSHFIEVPNQIHVRVPKPMISVQRLRGNRVHVKWEPSPRNPHHMKYCIVVNSYQDYPSLCAAQGVKYGVLPPDLMHISYYNFQLDSNHTNTHNNHNHPKYPNRPSYQQVHRQREREDASHSNTRNRHSSFVDSEKARDLIIGCVNKKTNYILSNLREGKLYYFNVFIKDSNTNLTYPYVRTTIKYTIPKIMQNGISDSKATKVTIPSGTSTLVKFNLKKPCSELSMYVMSCGGGAITYQLIHAYKSIIESQPVDSLHVVKIASPLKGRYYIRLKQSPVLNNFNSSMAIVAEVYVSKKNKRFPLPKLPYNTQVIEEHKSRSCDSVKILWHPSPEPRDNEYCIFLKEDNRKIIFNFKKPNQCDVERSLNSDPYVTHSLCLQRNPATQGGYLSQTIRGLHPGKTYISQLIIRRHKGKALSYDLFQVSTLKECQEY